MKKNILIDGQVFQSGAWHRGMGKYSLELVKSLIENSSDKSVFYLLLNNNLEIDQKALGILQELFGKNHILKEDLVLATRSASKDIVQNKRILNSIVKSKFADEPVSYLILSLFLDNGCATFPDVAEKYLLFYDSIPFLFPNKYIDRINYDNYLTHYKTVFEADKIFAISQTVADDTVLNFGISSEKVVNINGARIGVPPEKIYQPKALENVNKYILCPTGDELRKNNLRAVQGFELYNQRNNSGYKLVLTSFFSDYTKQQLSAISDNLIFTGNIPFEELEWLYENADLLLFPSEYEGLGLPILEAITHNKKIACSDIPVFREISEDAFYFFDPTNSIEISKTIEQSLKQDAHYSPDTYRKIESKYTWKNTGTTALNIIKSTTYTPKKELPSLAVLAPSPDGYSAIGKVVAETHAALSEYFEVTYYFEKGPQHRYLRPDFLSKIATNHSISKFNKQEYEKYDAVLYHIGNSEYHLSTIANALVYPGFCIFHDTNLSGAYGLLKDMGLMSSERYVLEMHLDTLLQTKKGKFLSTIASQQIHNFVHSNYAKQALKEATPDDAKCTKLNLPVDVPMLSRHHKNNDRITVGLAGIIAGIKGIELIEELSAKSDNGIDIVVFGYLQSDVIKDQLRRLTNVTLVTNPTDFEFQTMLGKLDILLNYRMQYQGETSLTVLEAMRYGVVPIVRDIGWYSELPDDAVIKVSSKEAALDKIHELINNRKELSVYSKAATEYISHNHSHADYAKAIHAAISKTKD